MAGAARYAPAGCRTAVAVDFGGTAVKRSLVFYEQNHLDRVRLLPAQTSPCRSPVRGARPIFPGEQLAEMAQLLAETWNDAHSAGFRPEPVFCIAVATYLYQGQPYPQEAHSCYGRLQSLGHLPAVLGEAVASLLQRPVEVRLMHDGTAAAAVYADTPRCVVITLGTAIGHGFPSTAQGLLPLAPTIAFDRSLLRKSQ
jgi:hypothetical protein